MSKNIALVEDEALLRDNYADSLKRNGYDVWEFSNRTDAYNSLSTRLPDLAIIDIGLEDEIDGGFSLCQDLRKISQTLPIIFLSARDSDYDIVSGLRMGADDYLTKDISLPNLLARISAIFRRISAHQNNDNEDDFVKNGNLILDLKRYAVSWRNTAIDLTITEFWLLYSMAKYPGHVKSRDQLMEDAKMVVDDSTITTHIKRIRRKFENIDSEFDNIETVYAAGYRWKS